MLKTGILTDNLLRYRRHEGEAQSINTHGARIISVDLTDGDLPESETNPIRVKAPCPSHSTVIRHDPITQFGCNDYIGTEGVMPVDGNPYATTPLPRDPDEITTVPLCG